MAEFNPFDIPRDDDRERDPGQSAQPVRTHAGPVRQPAAPSPETGERPPKHPGGLPRRFWGILAAVVAVVAVALIFGNAILVKLAPTWALTRGAAKTTAAVSRRIEESPYRAMELFGKSLLSGSVGCGFSYDNGDSSGNGQVTLTSSLKDKSMSLAGAATVDGRNVDAELFLNDQRAALRSSALDDCYGITYATFEDDLRASALPAYLGLGEEEIRQAGQAMEQLTRTMEFDYSGLLEAYGNLGREFLGKLDFSSEQDKVSVGGRRISCTLVSAELDEKDLRDLVLDAYDLLADDEDVGNLVVSTMTLEGNCTVEQAEQMYREQMQAARSELESQLRRFQCDLELTYCLSGGSLVQIQADGDVTVEGRSLEMELLMDFGQDPEKDDWLLSCNLSSDFGDAVTVEMAYTSDEDGDAYADCLTIGMDQGYGWEQMSLETRWDRDSGDCVISAYSQGQMQTLHCNLLVNGDSFQLTLNDFDDLFIESGTRLELVLTADQSAELEDPEYVNLDQWDTAVLEHFQAAAASLSGERAGAAYDYD